MANRPIWYCALLFVLTVCVSSCSTKAERYAHHVARGQELVKEGKDVKASLEFKTALQSNPAGTEANYQLGMIAERLNQWGAARDFFTKVTDQDPKHVLALLEEGRIYIMADDEDAALDIGNKAVSLAPQSAPAHALRGAALLRKDRLDDAEREAQASLKIAAANSQGIAVLAGIRARQNQPAQALEILDQGIKANPSDQGLKLAKLQILDRQGDQDAALSVLRELVAAEPKVMSYRLDLMRRLLKAGQSDAAVVVLRDGTKAMPGDMTAELALISFLKEIKGEAAAEAEVSAQLALNPKSDDLKLLLSELYFNAGKKDQARQMLTALLDKDASKKTLLTVRTTLARYAIADHRIDEAKVEVAKALELDPASTDALILRASIAASTRNYPGAIADLRNALKSEPDSKPALAALARTYEMMGETQLGADYYQRALDSDPSDLNLRVEFARQLLTDGQAGEADDQARRVLSSSPKFAPALLAHAWALAAQQKWSEAEAAAQALSENTATAAEGSLLLGKIFLASKQYADAVTELKQAVALSPQNVEAERSLALAYARSGDTNAADQYLQSLIHAHPNATSVYQIVGDVKASLGSAKEAEAAYRQAISLDPRSITARLALGDLLASQANYQSAANVYAEGLKTAPDNVELQFGTGYSEDRLNQFDAARAAYEAVLKAHPRNVAAANNLAGLIADAWPGDKTLLERARRLTEPNRNSTNPALVDTLGWVQFRLGNLDDALALLQRAANADPKNPQIRYHLGVALLKAGFKDKARGEFQLSIASNTPYRGLDDARKALASD